MVLNKISLNNAKGINGIYFHFEKHPTPEQVSITNDLNKYGEFTVDDPTVLDTLSENPSNRNKLSDNALSKLQNAYIKQFLQEHFWYTNANEKKAINMLKSIKWSTKIGQNAD